MLTVVCAVMTSFTGDRITPPVFTSVKTGTPSPGMNALFSAATSMTMTSSGLMRGVTFRMIPAWSCRMTGFDDPVVLMLTPSTIGTCCPT